MCCRRSAGTWVKFGGQSGGVGSLACASVISVMMTHCTGARIRDVGMTGSLGTFEDVAKSYCLKRASAFPFFDPGR